MWGQKKYLEEKVETEENREWSEFVWRMKEPIWNLNSALALFKAKISKRKI